MKSKLYVGQVVCFNCTNPGIGVVEKIGRKWIHFKWFSNCSETLRISQVNPDDLLDVNSVLNLQ